MPVIESPHADSWPHPGRGSELFGHCFLLRLDPVASVAALDDEEATRVASLIPRHWFIAVTLAAGGTGLYASDGRGFLNFRFCLVGKSVPTEFEPGAVSIAPLEPLVPDRPSLRFVPALPVDGLYVHTYSCMSAVVSRIHDTSEGPLAVLSPEQHQLLRRYQAGDEYSHGMFMHEKQVAEEQAKLAMLAASPNKADPTPPAAEEGSDRSMSSASGSIGGSEVSDIRYLLTEDMQNRYRRVRIFVEVWLDPGFHAGPPTDPGKFEQATAEVKAIWEDWKERMLKETLAKRPQTQEWLQGLRDADGGVDEAVPPVDAEISYDDHAVLPEDAIDSRMEKDSLAIQVVPLVPETETASGLSDPASRTNELHIESQQDGKRSQVPQSGDSEALCDLEQEAGAALPLDQNSPGTEKDRSAQNSTNQPAITNSSSRETGLPRVPKRFHAVTLRGILSNLRLTLRHTKAQAIRVFNKDVKQPVLPA